MTSFNSSTPLPRRSFCAQSGLLLGGLLLHSQGLSQTTSNENRLALGFDNFSIRALGWKAERLIEYADQQKVDSLLFSDLQVYDSHDKQYLRDIGKEAQSKNLILHAGTGGICPTSQSFKDTYGSADEHLQLLVETAHAVGSNVARCYLGSMKDRKGPGGIGKHVDSTLAILKKIRPRALDLGVRLAIENHAGDLHSRELKDLVERAGPEFVGVTLDTGNSTWTLEDPLETFRNLAPYAICSGIRDSMVWPSEKGVKVQWTAMGEGCVDLRTLFAEWKLHCPEVPVHLETISGFAKEFPYLEEDFWPPYSKIRSDDFARFLSLSRKGEVLASFSPPKGVDRKTAQKEYQLSELEKSFSYCRKSLGMGRKTA
jgi:sugar phosphate isomerase/epimerase